MVNSLNYKDIDSILNWINKKGGKKPISIILGSNVNGLSFVRSLYKSRIPTLIIDSQKMHGMYTRLGKTMLMPEISSNEKVKWLYLFKNIGEKSKKKCVIIPTSDEYALFISNHSDFFSKYFYFIVPEKKVMERIIDKKRQYEFAKDIGIPIPQTFFPDNIDKVRSIVDSIKYPCILKPYISYIGVKKIRKKVIVIDNSYQLLKHYSISYEDGLNMMIQEIIPGGDDSLFGYMGFWDNDNSEIAYITKQKIRQHPPGFGSGSLQIAVKKTEIIETSRLLLKKINFKGLVGIEFKYDLRDGKYKLIEINPRSVSNNQLAITAGVDFPNIVYEYLVNNKRNYNYGKFQIGTKYVHETGDFETFRILRKNNEISLTEWLLSLKDVNARAIFALNDPGPMITDIKRYIYNMLSKFFK